MDWAPFLRFGVTFVHANLCMQTLTPSPLGWEGGRGLFEIFSSSWVGKRVERFEKKHYCLKMYIHKKHQFFWYDKNTVRTTRNQPSVPCFKPLLNDVKVFPETSLVVTCCAVALGFFNFYVVVRECSHRKCTNF